MRYWMAVSALLVGIAVVGCSESKYEGDEKDEKISMEQVPAPAKATLLSAAGNGKLGDVDVETEDSKIEYTADAVIDGKNYEIKVAANGTLISKKLDDDDHDHDHKCK